MGNMAENIPIKLHRRVPGLLFLILLAAPTAGFAQVAEPALELADHTGQARKLDDYRGHVVVLNFWATWCGPCAAEMPRFVETQSLYGSRGVTVLAVSLDAAETQVNIPAFVTKYKMNFPVLVGATVDHLHLFEMGDGLPGTVFLDPEGHVFARIHGEAKKKDIFARVDWLLGDRKGKNPKPPKPLLGKPVKSP